MPIQTSIPRCSFLVCLLLPLAFFAKGQTNLIPAGKLQVHYQVQGNGSPIIFIHAGYQEMGMWSQQVAYFKDYNTVITIDLPGHGETKGIDTTLLVKDVIRICMDSLHILKASFVGLSLGGACVQDFVLGYPERVEKVILVGSGLSGWSDVLSMDTISKACFARMTDIAATNNQDSFAHAFTQIWGIGISRKPESVDSKVSDYVFQTTLTNLKQHPEDNRFPQFDSAKAAIRIRQHQWQKPLLIIYGNQDLPFIVAVANWLHSSIPGSKELMVPNAAHMVNMEQPLLFNRAVRSFLLKNGS